MSPVGWRGEHLSSGRLLSGSGAHGRALLPAGGGCGAPPPRAGCRPLFAKHMVSLSSFFTGNRDS